MISLEQGGDTRKPDLWEGMGRLGGGGKGKDKVQEEKSLGRGPVLRGAVEIFQGVLEK